MNHRILKLLLAWIVLAASALSAVPGWSATMEQMQSERQNIKKEAERMDREIAAMKSENQVLQTEVKRINAALSNPKLYVIGVRPANRDGWVTMTEEQVDDFAHSIAVDLLLTGTRSAREGSYTPLHPEEIKHKLKQTSDAWKEKKLALRKMDITKRIDQNNQDIAQQQAARQKLLDRFVDLENQLSGKKVKTAVSGFPLSWTFHAICPSGKYKGKYRSGWSMTPPDLNGDFAGSFAGTHTGTIHGTVSGTGIRFKRTFMRDGAKVIQTWTGTVDSTGKNISGSLTDPKGGCSFTATAQ